jgi:hypothetical protein
MTTHATHTIMSIAFGEHYVDMFLSVNLPSLLAPGNLPALAGRAEFVLYTSHADLARIEASPHFPLLQQAVRVRVVPIEELAPQGISGYQKMMYCQSHAWQEAAHLDRRMILNYADLVWGDGHLDNLVRLPAPETRVAYCFGVRMDHELFTPRLDAFRKPGGELQAPIRELVRIMPETLFIEYKRYLWNSDSFTNHTPSCILYPVEDQGYICNSLHLCPIMIWPRPGGRLLQPDDPQIDVGLFMEDVTGTDFSRLHIFTDSDELFMFGIDSHRLYNYPFTDQLREPLDLLKVASWCAENTNELNRYLFAQSIFVHAGELDERWRAPAQLASCLSGNLLTLIDAVVAGRGGTATTQPRPDRGAPPGGEPFHEELSAFTERLIRDGCYDKAFAIIANLLQQDQHDYTANLLMASLCSATGRSAESLSFLARTLQSPRREPQTRFMRTTL